MRRNDEGVLRQERQLPWRRVATQYLHLHVLLVDTDPGDDGRRSASDDRVRVHIRRHRVSRRRTRLRYHHWQRRQHHLKHERRANRIPGEDGWRQEIHGSFFLIRFKATGKV